MTATVELKDLKRALNVRAEEGSVFLTVYSETIELTPQQAQRFASWLAGAYVQAAGGIHRAPNGALVIGAAS